MSWQPGGPADPQPGHTYRFQFPFAQFYTGRVDSFEWDPDTFTERLSCDDGFFTWESAEWGFKFKEVN